MGQKEEKKEKEKEEKKKENCRGRDGVEDSIGGPRGPKTKDSIQMILWTKLRVRVSVSSSSQLRFSWTTIYGSLLPHLSSPA